MDVRSKRASLEEQRKRWMEDRQNTLAQNEAYSQTKQDMQRYNTSPRGASSVPRGDKNQRAVVRGAETRDHLADESVLFNKLTEKITKQIRRDVKEEISNNINSEDMRNAMVDKMDRYLEAELHTHTCKICFELMTSPLHTPMLLFPCGHTFCKECVDKHHTSQRQKSTCPYCRHVIESIAINQSLKDLIDNFASQREKMKDGHSKLNDIFDSSRHGSSSRGGSVDQRDDNNSYKMQINANEMRRVILENQLEEDAAALEKMKKRKKNITAATNHLQKERDSVNEKITLLQEELALIDTHLTEQNDKLQETVADEASLKDGMGLVQMSIASIEADVDKLRILSQNDCTY